MDLRRQVFFLFDDTISFQEIQVFGYFAVSIYCRVVKHEFAKRMRKGRTRDLLKKKEAEQKVDDFSPHKEATLQRSKVAQTADKGAAFLGKQPLSA